MVTMWWSMIVILLLWTAPVVLGLELDEARHLLARQQFLHRVLRGQDMSSSTDVQMTPGLPAEQFTHMLLPIAPIHPLPKDAQGRMLLEHLMLDPVYQLQ